MKPKDSIRISVPLQKLTKKISFTDMRQSINEEIGVQDLQQERMPNRGVLVSPHRSKRSIQLLPPISDIDPLSQMHNTPEPEGFGSTGQSS